MPHMAYREFEGAKALITGGASGIGLALGRELAALGGKVCLVDIDEAAAGDASRLISQEGGTCLPIVEDIGGTPGIDRAFAQVRRDFGRLDLLVNNAGGVLATPSDFLEVTEAQYDLVMNVNLRSAFFCAQRAVPLMGSGASILNFSSVTGRTGLDFTSAQYSAAKAAIIGLTRNLAVQLAPRGIRVNAVAPGFTKTTEAVEAVWATRDEASFMKRVPLGRRAESAETAAAAMFLLSPRASYITGAVLDVNGGLTMT